ncbi:MAG: hypothetical protein KDB00_18980, partial [Planctomycetales bacterium]|nr:hypothetical protein [Planctomycetales bacterium]
NTPWSAKPGTECPATTNDITGNTLGPWKRNDQTVPRTNRYSIDRLFNPAVQWFHFVAIDSVGNFLGPTGR